MNLLTKKQAELLKNTVPEREYYYVGELFPTIFDCDSITQLDKLDVKITHLGHFELNNNTLEKLKCPVCGKENCLTPYFCGGSFMSGAHVIKFICSECKEHIAVNNKKEYFNKIKSLLVKTKHKSRFNTETLFL